MLWHFTVVLAVIFRDTRRGMYLGRIHDDIMMSPFPEEAMDLSIQDTDPVTISTILSLGTKALTVDKNSIKLYISDISFNDKRQFFKLILTPGGTYIFQHDDLCVGYSSNFTHKLIDATNKSPYLFTEMVECTDTQNTMAFLKSEKIDGEAKAKKIIGMDPLANREIVSGKSSYVMKFEEQIMKPEETGFLKGVVGKVTHLF